MLQQTKEKTKEKIKEKSASAERQPNLEGLNRLPQVLQLIPVSASEWWAGCREGRFPQPIHLSPRVTVWRGADLQRIIDGENDFSKTDSR